MRGGNTELLNPMRGPFAQFMVKQVAPLNCTYVTYPKASAKFGVLWSGIEPGTPQEPALLHQCEQCEAFLNQVTYCSQHSARGQTHPQYAVICYLCGMQKHKDCSCLNGQCVALQRAQAKVVSLLIKSTCFAPSLLSKNLRCASLLSTNTTIGNHLISKLPM